LVGRMNKGNGNSREREWNGGELTERCMIGMRCESWESMWGGGGLKLGFCIVVRWVTLESC
jgi:hypothetical protein